MWLYNWVITRLFHSKCKLNKSSKYRYKYQALVDNTIFSSVIPVRRNKFTVLDHASSTCTFSFITTEENLKKKFSAKKLQLKVFKVVNNNRTLVRFFEHLGSFQLALDSIFLSFTRWEHPCWIWCSFFRLPWLQTFQEIPFVNAEFYCLWYVLLTKQTLEKLQLKLLL